MSPPRRRGSLAVRLAAASTALVLAAGCSSAGAKAKAGAFVPPPVPTVEPGPIPEGEVDMVVWPGYAEPQWTTDFRNQTGCAVKATLANSSDEMVSDVKSGQFDVVSASGDASLRLIQSADVAPVDVNKVPNYKDIYPSLKMQPWNSVGSVAYGIPQGRGANVLLYNKDRVSPAPTSWKAVFDPSSPYTGKVTAYDSPISIADAALYLSKAKPELGIKNPYALDRTQFDAAVDVLTKQHGILKGYWSDALQEQKDFENGAEVLGTSWQLVLNGAARDGHRELAAAHTEEGSTGWSDTWMIAAGARHPACAYKWLDYIVSAKVNAEVAVFTGTAPANNQACSHMPDAAFCTQFHANDEDYWKNVWYWTTPTAYCVDDSNRTCVPYSEWVTAWKKLTQGGR